MSASNIIGQTRLLNTVNKYTLSNLPKTLLFLGPEGCGKKTFIEYLAKRLELDVVKLDKTTTAEQLVEFSQKTVPTIYHIDLTELLEKEQNQFLKFIEEPADSVFVMLTAESEVGILPTILNRCLRLTFEHYTKEDLMLFHWGNTETNSLIYEICKTPGEIINLDTKQFERLYGLCTGFIRDIKGATYANTLSISRQINYKDTYDKFDFEFFFDVLDYVALKAYREGNEVGLTVSLVLSKFRNLRANKRIVKENFMLNFLTQVWKETR